MLRRATASLKPSFGGWWLDAEREARGDMDEKADESDGEMQTQVE